VTRFYDGSCLRPSHITSYYIVEGKSKIAAACNNGMAIQTCNDIGKSITAFYYYDSTCRTGISETSRFDVDKCYEYDSPKIVDGMKLYSEKYACGSSSLATISASVLFLAAALLVVQ
jgi:hypothetical protein